MYGVFSVSPALFSVFFTRISSFIPPPDLCEAGTTVILILQMKRNTLIPCEQAHLSTPAALFVKEWLWTSS